MTESVSYSLQVTEEEIMAIVPNGIDEIWEFVDKIPYLVQKYGKKILIAYQVYTLPKYYRYGQTFFENANERYIEYGKQLADKLGIPQGIIVSLAIAFARACVNFVLFGGEESLQAQLFYIKESLKLFTENGFKTEV